MTFYTGKNNIFYLELAIDRTEFIKLHDFEVQEVSPDEVLAQAAAAAKGVPVAVPASNTDQDELLKSLGM